MLCRGPIATSYIDSNQIMECGAACFAIRQREDGITPDRTARPGEVLVDGASHVIGERWDRTASMFRDRCQGSRRELSDPWNSSQNTFRNTQLVPAKFASVYC